MSPQILRFCRPVRLEYIKESKETILRIKAEIEAEMVELGPLLVKLPMKIRF